jgi:hypothetical protein
MKIQPCLFIHNTKHFVFDEVFQINKSSKARSDVKKNTAWITKFKRYIPIDFNTIPP